MYGWYRLLEIYSETLNPKACLVCMAEIIDQCLEDGIKYYSKFPGWMEDILNRLVANYGLKGIKKLVRDMELMDCEPLIDALDKCQYWRVEGFDY